MAAILNSPVARSPESSSLRLLVSEGYGSKSAILQGARQDAEMGQKELKLAGLGGYLPETPVPSRAALTGYCVSRRTVRVKPDTQEIRRQYRDEVSTKLNSSTKVRTIALVWFLVCVPALLAQVQPPLRIGPFGGIPESLAPIKIPRELEPFVPNGCVLRAALHTRMAAKGETLFLYDNGERFAPEVHLRALRNSQTARLFDGRVSAIAGIQAIPNGTNRELVGFAYHEGGDEADTTFLIFAARNGFYRQVFKQQTGTGRMWITDNSPVTFQTWSAEWQLDRADSCIWCKHRYWVRTYVWRHNRFRLTSQRVTRTFFDAGAMAARPFVLVGVQRYGASTWRKT